MPKSELEGRGEERARRIDRYCNYDIFLDSFCSLGNQYMQVRKGGEGESSKTKPVLFSFFFLLLLSDSHNKGRERNKR